MPEKRTTSATCAVPLERDAGAQAERGAAPPPFRLRIAHFILLTAICATINTLWISWGRGDEAPGETAGMFKLWVGVNSLLYGTAITALLILLGRRWRYGHAEPRHPGHVILLFLAAVAVIRGETAMLLTIYRLSDTSLNVAFNVWNLEKLLLCSSVGVTSLGFAWWMRGSWWWKSILALPGVTLLALTPQHVFVLWGVWRPWFSQAHDYASLAVSAAILVLLALACLSDCRRGQARDWLHWTGVLVTAGAFVFQPLYVLYVWYRQ